jgi:hypothetical protein
MKGSHLGVVTLFGNFLAELLIVLTAKIMPHKIMASQVMPLFYVGDEIAAIEPEVHDSGCVLNVTEEVLKNGIALLETDIVFKRFTIYCVDGGRCRC